ncbi:AraC family transcriptional regulator [Leptospira biflexa]|uniref:helix-turn-helix domain-containing protein n=1 Tax=Leptospira biflexa TaxID=172 RepID=UPI0010910C52|nr:helix-turn-helix domain-containing protein [Leptospira biflexa]TGM47392.1 AraC family transcriptional regulator [Leptospira biflexa]TGM50142.1 AraC family transcriptional regulator [Leptospira biflexa]
MEREKGIPTKGVLRQKKTQTFTKQNRYFPKKSLQFFIEHYWSVEWNLPTNEMFVAETLPYPSVHLVFENRNSKVYGVHQKKFSICLQGKGSVFGVKFRPGGFFPFYKKTISSLTNLTIPIKSLALPSNVDILKIESKICLTNNIKDRIIIIENWFDQLKPIRDSKIDTINHIIDDIKSDVSITKVEQISKLHTIKIRTLQRLFLEYVGVNPKWVILQFRMQEILERLEKEQMIHFADFSNEFGFFDQAHFNRMFKKFIGFTPEKYLESLK